VNTRKPKTRLIIAVSGLLVLVIGYFAIVGLLNWINRPADEAEAEALAEQSELNAQILQDQLSDQLTNGPISVEQERLDSPMGLALMRQCLEWTEFQENHPSDLTLKNRTASCAGYNEYIATGKVPE